MATLDELRERLEKFKKYAVENGGLDGQEEVLLDDFDWLLRRVETLFDTIKHGSDEHQQWLKDVIQMHFDVSH